MRLKTSLFLLSTVLFLSCMKDETTELTELIIEETIVTNFPQIPEDEIPETDLTMAVSWINNIQSENGLLESSENTNFVSLYDNALAALVFMELNEMERAEKIRLFQWASQQ